ncbi:MAG: flagellar motor stator protein MotA [bacterium]|nr:flagellar motor stator protein MotA [bacterium]
MFVIVGYIIILGCVIGGFILAGGHVGVLIQPVEILIIAGAAFGSFVSGNSLYNIKSSIAGALGCLKGEQYTTDFYNQLLLSFNALAQKARKEGMLALEAVVENPDSSNVFGQKILADHHLMEFITDNLRLVITGVDIHQFEDMMDLAIEVHHKEGHAPIAAVQRLGDGMPAFGIVAAVMGVVHTMESVGIPPAELGKLIAAALVGTFLGILLSYGFVGPVASVMEDRLDKGSNAYKCAMKGLLNVAKGQSPMMVVEFMRSSIASEVRPSFSEVDEMLKANKG